MDNIGKIVKSMGGQSVMALRMGVSQSAVWKWIQSGKVPAKYIKRVSAMTNNKITVEQLLYDHEIKEP